MPEFPDRRLPMDAILFCADCEHEFGKAKNHALGFYFICPAEKDKNTPHLARVILDQRAARAWLLWERRLLAFQTKWSPFGALRRLKFLCNMQAGPYVIASTFLLCLALPAWEWLMLVPGLSGCILRVILFGLVCWRFVDLFVTNVSITFTSRFAANPVRSVVYSFAGYIQVALSFALVYVILGHPHFVKDADPISAVFFSFATIATVGYGDLMPVTTLARLVVAGELVLGLFFVAIIIAQVAGWTSSSRREEGEYPIEKLRSDE